MINSDIDESSRSSLLIEADKKNIRIESVTVIVLGTFYLILFGIIMNPTYFYCFMPIFILYIVTGILGCMSTKNNSSAFQSIYKVLIIISLIAKVIMIILSIILIVELLVNPVECSNSNDESCSLEGSLWLIILIVIVVGIVVFSATLILLYVMLKHLNKYREDIKSLGHILIT